MSAEELSEVQRLRCKLKETEEALEKAAQYGLQLLESQHELQNQLEEQRAEMTNSIEVLEQDKYSFQREVELKNRMLDSMASECESLKQQQKLLWEQHETQLKMSHIREIDEYKNKLEKMKADLEETQLSEKQLRHKLDVQSEILSSKTEELRTLSERAHETMSSEMLDLQLEKAELEDAKAALEHEVNEMRYRQQQLELTSTTLQRQVERLTEEKEEREKEAVSYFNALEKSREINEDLQIQLDQALRQAQDPNSKGNSLFSEVEDRRAEMERQLISMKVQYESLQKQHSYSRQQLHRMKVQIATLLQLKGSHADAGQLERLQTMLNQKNHEIETLMVKLHHLEKLELNHRVEPSTEVENEDGTYYTDLLKMQLMNSKKESDRLGNELSLQRMKALAESQKVLEVERKLFSSEKTLKLFQSENIKLRVQVDELRMKYEPHEMNKSRIQKRRREKLPVDIQENGPTQEDTKNVCSTSVPTIFQSTASAESFISTQENIQPLEAEKQLPRDTKKVRISEEPPATATISPRSSPLDHKIGSINEAERGAEYKMPERKKREKTCSVIHVPSKPTSESQCAQQ
ncbi:protein Spindly [Polypterus senegalus]|uniref:protein Spindly n=1 Tax=Polypterus senegalus TaxID=55291 RepID=UPI001966822E|nr:protein Spindly [Polypterus senegalus]XP_039632429.1 protein Spindly [Polypterus senegalus]XP_039632430.1 protein Spindly [Polypterus senegalus]XP_039632431.1 protein Spindly [Polypterus senegalus]